MNAFLLALLAVGPPMEPPTPTVALARSRALLHRSGDTFRTKRTCFACHHQTLQVLVEHSFVETKRPADRKRMQAHAEHVHAYFTERAEAIGAGKPLPGGAYSAAYGLWTFALADHPADDTTTAIVAYLLHVQERDGSWFTTCNRPPLQGSRLAATVLSLAMLKRYGTAEQAGAIARAEERARAWWKKEKPESLEDHAWHLWGLHTLGGDAKARQTARNALLSLQRPDGGWAPNRERGSDAFATAQALYMLQLAGTPREHRALERGVRWLLREQWADGSWRVETFAKPVQPPYDNGDPHGKHQFVSIAATAWATAALAKWSR